jgi:exodeoxyribonuclease V beta subunit
MQTLDPKTVPLTGTNLIEASAGTGKTWTISWLYLRLVATHGLTVDKILVVTYTDAATAELRDRIRKRLADALAFLEGRNSDDTYEALLDEAAKDECIQRLQLALVSFDEAAVFTIHGFCKRVLTENAFEARLPFESELVTNEDTLLTELADAFWYQHFLNPDALHLALLRKHALTPDKLLGDVRQFIGKPYLQESIPAVDAEDFASLQSGFEAAFQACQASWAGARDSIVGLLLAGALNGNSYSKKHVPNWAGKLDKLFAGEFLLDEVQDVLQRFSTVALTEKTKDGKATPTHPFFDLSDELLLAWVGLQNSGQAALEQLRLQLLHHLRRELPVRKQQLGILTFDDLLLHLDKSLQQHPEFASRLAKKYQAALIDEFQDTDPIQYAIFAQIYADAGQPVFYVGDPKQAIYGFRGADIYTYLTAANAAQHRHTLGKNFRSHADLLAALNHLFAQAEDPFRSGKGIAYTPVEAGQPQDTLLLPEPLSALRIWDWDKLGESCNISTVQDAIAEAVADDIARLLNAAQQGHASIGKRPVASSDIAVLVREHSQGERVKQALLQRGITSVQKSRENIFHTREATELRAVLRAIAEPGNEAALKQALVTELFAYTASRLQALDEQPQTLEAELEAFHRWHQVWHVQGFMPMFRQWLTQRQVYAHLLAMADGERRLTNLLHLAELIHTEGRLHGHGMHALIRWLQQQAEQGHKDEHPLRLESDANLVQIVTIHKSKGLEYGIVYCPYLWKEKEARTPPAWFSWYDGEAGASCLQAHALAHEDEKRSSREAEKAESLRLLYVALTRAKYHCTVAMVSGQINQFDYYSALGWLLFGKLEQGNEILGKLVKGAMQAEERQQRMHRQLSEIVASSDGLLSHVALPEVGEPVRYQAEVCTTVTPGRTLAPVLPPVPKVGSFSGLASGKEDERPDYDVLVWQTPVEREAVRTAFPRGAQAGSCLHKMLEKLDFIQPLAGQESVLRDALQQHGLAERWREAAENLLGNALSTELRSGIRLADLPKQRRLDELEFYFPVGRLRLKPLQAILHRHLPADWVDIHAAIDKLKFNNLTGFMKGFVDLVFEADGQYFIVDYKSNELGSTPESYTQTAMQQAMAEHHYYLQYLIYCLALHRYLRQRLAEYTWDAHVGGALYLFLRGMQPGSTGSGVFFHKPDAALMDALDRLMDK